MIHPVLCKTRNIGWYIAIWGAMTIIHTIVLNHFYGIGILTAFTDGFVYYSLFGGIAIGVWYPVRYNEIESTQTSDLLINHSAIAIISLLAWFYAGYYILTNVFENDQSYNTFVYQSIPWRMAFGLFFYCVIVLIYYLNMSFQSLQEKSRNEAELRALVQETELNMLKSQINPHFLFNSLNSISSLTITNPSKAQTMIIKLSEFLRRSIGHKEKQMASLDEEMEHIGLYLEIEKVRFGDRLRYIFDIDPLCCKFPIPAMLLQPLFENAIKHGVYESTEEITIQFKCAPVASGMKISIVNNFDPEAPPRKGNQIGIKNIVNRLRLIYQYDDLLRIHRSSNRFEVEIIIPNKEQA